MTIDLFDTSVGDDRLHPNFKSLRDSPWHSDARRLICDLFARMGDTDGAFIRDFRGGGFHARLFELAVYAYLGESGYSIERTSTRPDFIATNRGTTIAFEATTANPTDGADRDISLLKFKDIEGENLAKRAQIDFPRRIVSALQRKVRKRYDTLPHCRGRPIVVAVAPYFEPGSVYYTDDDLVDCLYGFRGDFTATGIRPFFKQEYARHVSAVLFCNQFTVPRFFRLASRFPRMDVTVVRSGTYLRDLDETNFGIGCYQYEVGDPTVPGEMWQQGVTLFTNPFALVPLPPDLCPHTSLLSANDEGGVVRQLGDFHPVTSLMQIISRQAVDGSPLKQC